MGLPVNNYTFFKAIAEDNQKDLQSWFKFNFSLFGYIIHDPKSNPEFDKSLSRCFYRLNIISGEDFLFTAFVDPPKCWIEWINSDSWSYSDFLEKFNDKFYYPNQIHNPNLIVKTVNPSLTALLISNALKINFNHLPYIILTPHPRDHEFYVMHLDSSRLVEQMAELTELSSLLKMGYRIEDAIKQTDLDLKKITLDQPLAKKLLSLSEELFKVSKNGENLEKHRVAFTPNIDHEKNDNEEEFEIRQLIDAYKLITKNLKSITKKMLCNDTLKNSTFHIHDRFLASCLSLDLNQISEFKSFVEPETYYFLVQGAMMKDIYTPESGDASSYALPFGKAFESEMAYSLVHWVRENYNINLPAYFFEYEMEKEVLIGDSPGVDFNFFDPYTSQWKPPMLGQQLFGVEKASVYLGTIPFSTKLDFKEFLSISFEIRNIRNSACHRGTNLTESDLHKIIVSWKELYEKGFLKTLYELKEKFRGTN